MTATYASKIDLVKIVTKEVRIDKIEDTPTWVLVAKSKTATVRRSTRYAIFLFVSPLRCGRSLMRTLP